MQTSIRLLVVDDHTHFRTALVDLLEEIDCVEVVDEAEDGESAVLKAQQLQPDVVLMDLKMPGIGGAEATRKIVATCPSVNVIGMSMYDPRTMAESSKDAGAVAYLPKNSSMAIIESAIRNAARREMDSKGSSLSNGGPLPT